MSVFDPVDLRVVQATQPYFVWGRLALNVPRVYAMYQVPYGYNYLIRQVISRWDMVGFGGGPTVTDPPLAAEVFNAASSRARQVGPVPFSLFSSPGGENTAVPLGGAPLGVSFFATSRTSARLVNIAFPFGDTIRVEVTGQIPGYTVLDIMLQGYLIAQGNLALWGAESPAVGVKNADS